MGANDYYLDGGWNVLDDRTGFKIKNTDARKEWTNAIVRSQSWEPRQPQDLIRSKKDRQAVPNPRSEPSDSFLTATEVTADDL